MALFESNPASLGGGQDFTGSVWVFPGLVLASPRLEGVLRYVAGYRGRGGWIWPVVEKSRAFRHLVWVEAISVYPDGRRERSDEVLAGYLLQARKAQRLECRDYSAAMAVLVNAGGEAGAQDGFPHRPYKESPVCYGVFREWG